MGINEEIHSKKPAVAGGGKRSGEIRELDRRLLLLAYGGDPGIEFHREVCRLILEDSGCESLELWFREKQKFYKCEMSTAISGDFKYEITPSVEDERGIPIPVIREDSIFAELRRMLIKGNLPDSLREYSRGNSLCVNNIDQFISSQWPTISRTTASSYRESGLKGSVTVIPVEFCYETIGVLQLSSERKRYFEPAEIKLYENIARTLGIVLMTQQAQSALRERVKELTCLYSISQVAEREGITLDGILQGIAELLPPAWQYPKATVGRIVLDGSIYSSPGFQELEQSQKSNIAVSGIKRGFVEVVYTSSKPELDEGPFLREERSLINAIAREVAMIVERKEAADEKTRLQEQLRHADRLATIGQLAAGVAHEINEPLGSMLGFAQLAGKHPGLPEQVEKDISKIEAASLHAREIVKKLMLFSRQMPPQKKPVDLNRMIDEGLYFIKSRCRKSNIEIILDLGVDLPVIIADQSQIYQVLVNLVVNAVQAMPDGGKLKIATGFNEDYVIMAIEDTGIGMDEEIQKKIFLPFFTTKEINEGTGIGLSVVHGIVTLHGGQIDVSSRPGEGTRFEIFLPVKSRGGNQEEADNDRRD